VLAVPGLKTLDKIADIFKIHVVDLMEKHKPGVFYFALCRSGKLYYKLNPHVDEAVLRTDLEQMAKFYKGDPSKISSAMAAWRTETEQEETRRRLLPGAERMTRMAGPRKFLSVTASDERKESKKRQRNG